MPKKLTYEDIKNYIKEQGYILLSEKYINNSIKLQIKCPEGHIFWMCFGDFQQGKRCPKCANKNKGQYQTFTYDQVKNYIKEQGYILLSEEYIIAQIKLQIKCPEKHIFWMKFDNFRQGQRCPECANKIRGQHCKLSYEQVKDYIKKQSYILLSKEYKNNQTKLKIQCPEGHIFWISFNSFQNGCRCPECYNKKRGSSQKLTYEDIKNYIKEQGYILLSKEYKNNREELKIQCPEGHVFWMSFSNFQKGCRCPECAGNRKFINQEIIEALNFCENIRENNNYQIEVTCTYCGKWFIPERKNLLDRIRYVDGEAQNEHRIYCSQQCKDECPIFNQKLYPKGFNLDKNILYTTEEYNIWRTTVLEREDYICQFCGGEANIAHHEKPQKTHPRLALDPNNGVACCSNCHYKYGHAAGTECSTGKLASKVC